MSKQFPEQYEHLKVLMAKLGADIPGTMAGFGRLHVMRQFLGHQIWGILKP